LARRLEPAHHLDDDIDSRRKHVSDIRGERQVGTESRLGSIPDERSDTADVDAGAPQAIARLCGDARNRLPYASISQQADANRTYITPGPSIDQLRAFDGKHRHTSPFSAPSFLEKRISGDGTTHACAAGQHDAANRGLPWERVVLPTAAQSTSLYLPRYRAGSSTWAVAAWLLWRRRACSLSHSR